MDDVAAKSAQADRSEGTPTAARVVVGRYTDSSGTAGLQRFRVAGDTLVREASLDLPSPSWAAWAGDRIAAVSELERSRLSIVAADAEGLTLVSSIESGGADACHVAASPDGAHLALAHYGSGSVLVTTDPADGDLSDADGHLVTFEGSGPVAGRQDQAHAHEVVWLDPTTLLVNDLGSDVIRRLTLGADGSVAEQSPIVLPPGFGPRHLRLRGRDELAVVGELSGEVLSLRHADGEWMITARVPATGTGRHAKPSGILLHDGGLIVGNREVNTVSRFAWSPEGELSLEWEAPCGGALPRDIQLGHGLLWLALMDSGEVVAHRLDGSGLTEVLRYPVEGAARILL